MATLLSSIMARIRRRCDMVGSTFLSDANDLLPWINASHRELYELLVDAYGQPYFMVTADTTVTATMRLELTDVFKLLRVDCAFDNVRVPMRPFRLSDQVLSDQAENWTAGTDIQYHFEGLGGSFTTTGFPALRFHPRPSGNHVIRVYYVPACETHTSFSVADVVGPAEVWDEYIVVDCAIKAKVKEDSDPQALLIEKAALKQRIIDSAPNRDAGQPQTVADVQSAHGGVDGLGRGDWWW